MRVSIIVTNFNYAGYVGQAIESALRQSHHDVEVVVVDDGSTDGSRAVVERYAGHATLVLKPNGGQASAVNAGFAASTGQAVLFLDADDTVLESAGATVSRLFADPAVVKAHWPLLLIDETGRADGTRFPAQCLAAGDLRDRLLSSPDYLTPPQSGNAYRRAFLSAVLPMPEAPFRTGADTYLFLLAPAFGRVAVADPQATYRRHDASNYSSHGFDERMAQLRIWSKASYDALEHHCRRLGVPADPAAWRRNAWVHRVSAAVARLDAIVGDDPFILVDGGDWGLTEDKRRRALPFLERDGEYWGPPADDAAAVAELERLRAAGATVAAFAFPAFWWLDHYPGLRRHLEARYSLVTRDADLLLYDLAGE